MRILFVCLGNICRSPTAEAATREALVAAGLDDRVEIDSAGIGDWHVGNPPDPRMRQAAQRVGLDLTGSARQVRPDELGRWDLILAMDHRNRTDLAAMAPDGVADRIRMFRSFDPSASGEEVPDPYYGGAEGFTTVVELCRAAARGLVDELATRLPDAR
ncbi:MAG TPA: low molecular weight protein-tyrosine-phosphatase [Euzebyales bacterium]|nr:low molecular weight protein-tyrosine-phosphatase [Euzebyales bacterium]